MRPRPRAARQVRAALAVGLTSVLALLALGGPAGASSGASSAGSPLQATPTPGVFGIGPSAAHKLDGRPYYYYLSGPGGQLSDHVAVVNVGTTPLTLSVYATDATNSADGSLAFPAAAAKPKDVGKWLHIAIPHGGTQVTVRARSTIVLPITMTVPADAIPGDHVGALVASLQGEVRGSGGQLVHLDQRVATRVFVRIAGPLHPRLAIEQLSATYQGRLSPFAKGDVIVTYVVHNTGNVRLGGDQSVEVSGLFGSAKATGVAQVPLLLPGGSAAERVVVHGVLPSLWMTGTVTVRALGLSTDLDPKAGPWTASTHFWAIPWTLLLLLLLLLTGLWVRRRRAHARRHPRETGRLMRTPAEARTGRMVVTAAAVVGALAAAVLAAPAAGADQGVPYTDLQSKGTIALCDAAGNRVVQGSVTDKPFVLTASSSVAAPAPFNGPGRTAVLLAYQPRQGVYPDQWHGDTLTATSQYTDAKHPMAVGTVLDFTLAQFLAEFPARWQGLVQLRIYYGAAGHGLYDGGYPTTDIQVTGSTWHVVRGGTGDCKTGKAVSNEVAIAKLPGATATPTGTRITATASATGGSPTSPGPSVSGSPSPGAGGGSASSGSPGSGGGAPPWVFAILLAGVAAAGGLLVWWRRQRPVPAG